jgi:hypothetical protein
MYYSLFKFTIQYVPEGGWTSHNTCYNLIMYQNQTQSLATKVMCAMGGFINNGFGAGDVEDLKYILIK